MLILSRHKGEEIVFPTLGIRIALVDLRGDTVKIGIDAPRDVPVHRSEVWDAIQREASPTTDG